MGIINGPRDEEDLGDHNRKDDGQGAIEHDLPGQRRRRLGAPRGSGCRDENPDDDEREDRNTNR